MSLIPVEIAGITYHQGSKGYAIVLRELDGRRQIPIIVGGVEAQAIALALEGVEMPRPLTHDLMTSMITELGSQMTKMLVTHISNETFYAQIFLLSEDRTTIKMDSRPSDAIALALRNDAPILVHERVFADVGEEGILAPPPVDPDSSSPDRPEQIRAASLKKLESALQDAIDGEEYEEAAKIRDRISNLKNE